MKACSGAANYHHIAREFGLGRVSDVTPLTDSHPEVVKVTTELGQFVIKPAYDGMRYWYHLYGRPRLDLAAVRASVAAANERREWTSTETAAWPAMVALEALPGPADGPPVRAKSGLIERVHQ